MKLALAFASMVMLATTSFADGPVRHVVCFKFKADADAAKIQQVETSFAALKGKIPLIQELEWGTDASPEKRSKGFTHIWILTFKNEADRDAYIVHPAHQEFVGSLKGVLDEPLVIDFIPKK